MDKYQTSLAMQMNERCNGIDLLCVERARGSPKESPFALLRYRNRKFAISEILKVWKWRFQSLHKFNMHALMRGFAGDKLRVDSYIPIPAYLTCHNFISVIKVNA